MEARQATFTFAAQGGSSYDLKVRLNRPNVSAEGGLLGGGKLHLQFPNGNGYQTKTVSFRW
jgi:hypothetical protein